MDRGEVLRCKPGGNMEFNYDRKTYQGYIYVEKLPFEYLDAITVDRIIKEIDFNNVQHVRDVMNEIRKLGPEFKITGHHAIESIPGEAFGTTENGIIAPESAVKNVEEKKAQQQTEKKDQPVKEKESKSPASEVKPKEQPSQKGETKKITDLKDLPQAMKDKLKSGSTDRPKEEAHSKSEPVKLKVQPEAPKSDEGLWPGTIKVGVESYHGAGYCLAHIYTNKEKEQEAVIYCSLKGFNKIESLPLIFAKEGQVRYFFEGMSKHPSLGSSIQSFNYYRLKDFDITTLGDKAYLVRDPRVYMDAVSAAVLETK